MLTIWKRHSDTCSATLDEKGIPINERRLYKDCNCACWVTGVHPITKTYIKKALGTTSWTSATRLKEQMESKTPAAIEGEAITIEKAYDQWVADRRRCGTGESTIDASYNSLQLAILRYAKQVGISQLCQLDKARTREMVVQWGRENAKPDRSQKGRKWKGWSDSTAALQLGKLRGFFDFCKGCDWITQNPAESIESAPSATEEVHPFTQAEMDRLFKALDDWPQRLGVKGGIWGRHQSTFKCLFHVFCDTGLRLSDAIRLRPELISPMPDGGGEWTLIQWKLDGKKKRKGAQVTVYLDPGTMEQLREIPWISDRYPFMRECRDESNRALMKRHVSTEGTQVYHAMQRLGRAAKVRNCRPHRLRHTFAVKKLESRWLLEDVSRLLGHKNTKITQDTYAHWTNKRQDLLRDQIMSERGGDNVIPFPKHKTA